MNIPHVKPEQFFLEKSFRSKHPNFKRIAAKYINKSILESEDTIAPKGGKGNAYRYTKTRLSRRHRIKC